MEIKLKKGVVFTCDIPESPIKHTFFVITNPDKNGKILCVNATTVTNGCDRSCILTKKDFIGLSHESFINYASPIYAKPKDILHQLNQGDCTYNTASDATIRKIIDGAAESDAIKPIHIKLLL